MRQFAESKTCRPHCVSSLSWIVHGWITRRLTTKADGTILDDSLCYPNPPTQEKSWPSCGTTTTVWYEEPDGPDGGWQALNVLGATCETGTWLFGLEAEKRIREAWIPLSNRREYIGHCALRKFLAELRLTDVSVIGGEVMVAETKQIGDSLGRCPAAIYGFDPVV